MVGWGVVWFARLGGEQSARRNGVTTDPAIIASEAAAVAGVLRSRYDEGFVGGFCSPVGAAPVKQQMIELRGVAVNNLRRVDLDLPHRELVVFCGVSGSGKTSLALDTLYAEGQRRYIESFSAYTRQFLEQLDKPEAERIAGIPPAIAVTHKNPSRSNRATVGTTTEVNDYLSMLLARVGDVICYGCGRPVRRETPDHAAETIAALPTGLRMMVGFELATPDDEPVEEWLAALVESGYVRMLMARDERPKVEGERSLVSVSIEPRLADRLTAGQPVTIVLAGAGVRRGCVCGWRRRRCCACGSGDRRGRGRRRSPAETVAHR
jgi:hypothetical protein